MSKKRALSDLATMFDKCGFDGVIVIGFDLHSENALRVTTRGRTPQFCSLMLTIAEQLVACINDGRVEMRG